MRIITADETGLVKVVRVESGNCLAISAGEQTRARAVQTLCHSGDYGCTQGDGGAGRTLYSSKADYRKFHIARTAGAVETWEALYSRRDGEVGDACSLSLHGVVDCPGNLLAMACLPPTISEGERSRIMTCSKDGQVQVVSSPLANTSAAAAAAEPKAFSIRGPISAAITAGTSAGGGGGGGASLAAGGQENDLKLYDVASSECTWKAKNAPHDFLDLRQAVWISSLRPLAPEEGLRKIVAGTAHRQVRLYDTRAQKRPTHSVDADEHGITTMAVARGSREVVVADTAGLVRVLDLRKMSWGRRFAGPGGSVRGLAFHPTLPCLACVGLDRTARVYDYKSAEQKYQVYLKQRLNAVLFDDEGKVSAASGGHGDEATAGTKNRGGGDGSGSEEEGWGSGEEYEMNEDSSSEDDDEDNTYGAAGNSNRVAQQARVQGSSDENDDTDASGDEEDGSKNVGRGGGSGPRRGGTEQRVIENGSRGPAGGGDSSSGSSEEDYNGSEEDGEGGLGIREAGGGGSSDGRDDGGDDSDESDSGWDEEESEEEIVPFPKRHVAAASSSSKKRRR